jgi:hypothetical protein
MRRFGWLGIAVLLAFVLSNCSGPPVEAPTHLVLSRLRVQIDLKSTHAVAGHPIKAALVIYNPQNAIDVTLSLSGQCKITFDVVLTRGSFHVEAGVPACSPQTFVISHGTTRLPFTLNTRYNQCPPGYHCTISNGKFLGFPPLPPGSYKAVTYWFTRATLPRPTPVTVVLT